MDEDKRSDIMETASQPGQLLSWRDAAIPLLALALAAVFWECFDPMRIGSFGLPHLGVLALVVCHFAAVFIVLGKRVKLSAGGLFCMGAALALGLACTLYQLEPFVVMNCFGILLTAAMATFSLSGRIRCGRGRSLFETVALSLAAFFSRLDLPFLAAVRACRRGKNNGGQIALAVAVALPVLAVVLWLLSSADAVFGSFFTRFDLSDLPAWVFINPLRAIFLALFLASALYFIREDPVREQMEKPQKPRHAAPFLLVTGLLDLVYIIFCVIQIRYLFGGAEAASMAGGWAEYARSGFFQLVAVTAINLGLCLLGTDAARFESRGGKALRVLFGLLLALTACILISAFRRMRLYIDAYGMSVLRLLTLWAMAVIGVGILAAAWKLVRPGFGFFRAAGGFALGLWCVLCLANPGCMIASYNVDHYLSGELAELDTYYLRGLSCDILPALSPLQQAGAEEQEQFDELAAYLSRSTTGDPWAQRSLSAWRAGKDAEPVKPILFETGKTADGGYKTILWEDRIYAPYGVLNAGRIDLGQKLGCLREDESIMIYALPDADPDMWLAEYTDEGWMDDPPMVYLALGVADTAVPDSVTSLEYDIWAK